MSNTHLIYSPLTVPVSRNKSFSLNLNPFRNTHHILLNKAKVNYKEAVSLQISKLPQLKKVNIIFTLFPKTKRSVDISNVCCIHDKFFCDALVELGKLPDDNYKHITSITYCFGSIDPSNPRVEILIIEV